MAASMYELQRGGKTAAMMLARGATKKRATKKRAKPASLRSQDMCAAGTFVVGTPSIRSNTSGFRGNLASYLDGRSAPATLRLFAIWGSIAALTRPHRRDRIARVFSWTC